ncbi:hypothetical protein [Nocardioides sp. 1609]|uniref:hypothetical protein n=1 Tax=Nocardioides sp. 1609 TaxID=2508327 RepID=UPI0014302CFF|nr:hypothetical protein [Nocardioides sp. 1609]
MRVDGQADPGEGLGGPVKPAAPEPPATQTQGLPVVPVVAEGYEQSTHAVGRSVTCPECGAVAEITVNRRESHDFCPRCDFPLFWTPAQLVLSDAESATQALRRLPGTGGRVTVGSLACPHCAEANPITGSLCLRCGGDLHPVAPPPAPAPAPVVVAPPPPAAEPERSIPLWWWVLGTITVFLLVAVVVVLVQR